MGTCAIGNIKMKRDMCVEKIRQVHLRRGGGFFLFIFWPQQPQSATGSLRIRCLCHARAFFVRYDHLASFTSHAKGLGIREYEVKAIRRTFTPMSHSCTEKGRSKSPCFEPVIDASIFNCYIRYLEIVNREKVGSRKYAPKSTCWYVVSLWSKSP
jgi:hypothetical protein